MGKYIEDENIRKQIDKLLEKIAKVECNLGADSTKAEFTKAKSRQEGYLEQIKVLDIEFYTVLCP